MTTINESIAREYFELQGYLINQPCKFTVAGKKKKPEEQIDLIIFNPSITEHILPTHLVWGTRDLLKVRGAIVGVSGRHTDRFYPGTLERAPELFAFSEESPLKTVARQLGLKNPAKILCLPQLPAAEQTRNESLAILQANGIDGVITFKTMLSELVRSININRNYEKSDVLQMIRLMKVYGLLQGRQMDLFANSQKTGKHKKTEDSKQTGDTP
ncbi:MAG: hypothetical protein GX811_10360 [Lentisphaerae bacterium]|jgi:hypothetical protein|nr:hypothetical protein [Lentisphaerota bacterium]